MGQMRIRKDDMVKVIGGKDRGKTGKRAPYRAEEGARSSSRASTSSSATSARRRSRTPQRGGEVGGIIEKEGPIHISNVMLLDPSDNKPTRVRVERSADGKRSASPCARARRSTDGSRDRAENHEKATEQQKQAAPPPRLRDAYEQRAQGRR